MAVDTTSPLLQLLLQGTGNNNNTWGANLNESVFLLIEQAIAGITTINCTDATDLTLTADEARSATIVFTGTPGAKKNILMPATAKRWTIINNTDKQLVIGVTGEVTTVNAPIGVPTDMISDGETIMRKDGDKVGELFFHAGTTAPEGALECDNAAYLQADYPDLYAKIGTTWGGGGASDFRVPPGKDTGRFVRSRTASVAVGTSQSSANKSHTHTGSGTTATENVGHTHTFSGTTALMNANAVHGHNINSASLGGAASYPVYRQASSPGVGIGNGGNFGPADSISNASVSTDHGHSFSGTTSDRSSAHTHTYSFTTSTGSADATEARPEAIVGILCIRY